MQNVDLSFARILEYLARESRETDDSDNTRHTDQRYSTSCKITQFHRDMNSLSNRTDEQLQQMQVQIDQALREVAARMDDDETLVEAVKTLLRSESVFEDYTTLLVSQPEIIKQLIGSSLSALVNVHLMISVADEVNRRANNLSDHSSTG